MKRFAAFLLAVSLGLTACAGASVPSPAAEDEAASEFSAESAGIPEPPPSPEPELDNEWRFDVPENHGMDPELFVRLHTALEGSAVYAMVTAKDGVIIDEYYQEGYDESSKCALHSCSKSFTGILTGIAIEQGLIGGPDDLLSDYLPQVLELADPRKLQLTLRHLLTHTSGLEWYEWGSGYSNWNEFQSASNWVEYILGRDLVAQPGAVFNYSTGNTHLLAAVLEAAVGMSELEYAKINLFDPLGMESVEWRTDPQGITDGGNGILMTARDAARFGQVCLEGGIWHDRQIIPAQWLEDSTRVQNPGPGGRTGEYGYQWWIRPFGSGNHRTFYAFGAWGQYILVVPKLNLVTVIASRGPQNSYAPLPYFTDYVLEAYQGAA
ncbi:serine hydrolase domain-containing protein [Yanshouia hominis]|uniref:Serine hydrolase n=1 Tax=Yanshouia hominis TaxID=2763673 RepID=A0ABR7NKP8_9FIRM|nr:serine hydrolase [Yanshouia hominis]MBC8576417.1 serine hydrolase [Yanshouia hominis]